jgi:hypothetical protein
MTQAYLTKGEAQSSLREACSRGLLFQGSDGRYYVSSRSGGSSSTSLAWAAKAITPDESLRYAVLQGRLSRHKHSLRRQISGLYFMVDRSVLPVRNPYAASYPFSTDFTLDEVERYIEEKIIAPKLAVTARPKSAKPPGSSRIAELRQRLGRTSEPSQS